jgi:predicted CopG family antitoxin
MARQVTITLPDDVYDELHRRVGQDNISGFIEQLVRPHVLLDLAENQLEEAYRAMAADTHRERDAWEWIEMAPDDALP